MLRNRKNRDGYAVMPISRYCSRDVLRSLSIHHLSVTQLLLGKITIRGNTPPVSFVPPTSTNHDPPMGVIQ